MLLMEKVFNPADFEDRIYSFWLDNGLFKPVDQSGIPFVIVIPPPNVTGVLHMGHGLNNSLQDVLIRYYRMKGFPTLWLPGTDHAGIATQNVVERKLKERGLTRHDLGRERFLEETWKVKNEHHSIIRRQLQKIGASCDWSRERFTLDEGLSNAVKEVFIRLYEKGLIYKGKYLVNWCSSCGTALSDDEVDHDEIEGALYTVIYPLEDGSGSLTVATTRPETMFGDTAVAVHPDDPRYAAMLGKNVRLPLTDRLIPVVADSYVDPQYGTGALKITPGHDPNDWEIGLRHDLPRINILNPDGTLNDEVPSIFRGMKAMEARRDVLNELRKGGYFVDQKKLPHKVGHCYRCSTIIEPYMSEQWFVRMQPLARKALKAWEDGLLNFFPKRWENTFTYWLKNIRDWCISRQLWWGHRIPVWYCRSCGREAVSRDDLNVCPDCGSTEIQQDPDVLDTWFSSWLWPFSTLGWPEETSDLRRFFPTTTLVTGYDIIFFWVARMIMASLEFTGKVPFRDIYITPLVRDKQGRKMSKSLGNGIDPLEIVDTYGADALKFTITFLSAQGQDVLLDHESFKLGSKFANKIWNASRYILMNTDPEKLPDVNDCELRSFDRWIYHRLNETVKSVETAFSQYKFNDMGHAVYEFFWNDFCDWYIEVSKKTLYSDDDSEKNRGGAILISLLEESLRLLHPFLPFITEEIYQKLPKHEKSIMTAAYPSWLKERENHELDLTIKVIREFVRGVRTLRSEFTIPPDKKFDVAVSVQSDSKAAVLFKENADVIVSLINAGNLRIQRKNLADDGGVGIVGNGFEAKAYIRSIIDTTREIDKMSRESVQLEKLIHTTSKKLQNDQFLEKAPEEIVGKEKDKLNEFTERHRKLKRYITELSR